MHLLFLSGTTLAGARREQASFEELYEASYAPILSYLRQLSGSPEQAEDLAQETFVRAYVGFVAFRGESAAATWLYRIARNTYLNTLRRSGSTQPAVQLPPTIEAPAQHADPAARYAAREQQQAIAAALAQLPEQQRSILLLRDSAGLGYGEIAAVLGISVGAVRMKLFRARNSFRTLYAEHDDTGAAHE